VRPMLKKSSSILQELGLNKQVRAERQPTRSLQEAPRPLGRPLVASATPEGTCAGVVAEASAPTAEPVKAAPVVPSPLPVPAEDVKVDAKLLESVAAERTTVAPSGVSRDNAPVERRKVDQPVSQLIVSRPQETARQAIAAEAKAQTSAGDIAESGRRRPPALGAPELRAVGRVAATQEAALVKSALPPPSLDLPPPKPSGSSTLASKSAAMPQELAGLRWPSCFLQDPRGGRVELTEDSARATRESGVGRGICFLGPLQPAATDGSVYFEIEVLELEAQRSQTIALGFATSLPAARPLLAERATDLGQGCFLVGYDLPKLFVHGEPAAKICARDWRPLKEICCGDRVGVLAARSASRSIDLTVYVNGTKKVSVTLPGIDESATSVNSLPWPGVEACSDLYGVVDIHGAVRSVRLRRPPTGPLPSAAAQPYRSVGQIGMPPRPLSVNSPPPTQGCALHARQMPTPRGSLRAFDRNGSAEADAPARKRPRLATFPSCNCTAHLRKKDDGLVHVSSIDFCIGRDTKVVNLALESEDAPNMVSRTHARIVSNDAGVQVIDCRSLNGTWLNGARVANHKLRSGDTLVIGNPSQGPPEFRFTVELPSN